MKRLLALVLALWFAAPAQAFLNNTGGSTAQFLRIGMGTRAGGLGEAYGPIAEGPSAIYWNPAGIARQETPEISYSHMEIASFFHYDALAYVHPIRQIRGSVGVSMATLYQDTLDLVSNTNVKRGSFRPHSEVLSLAYATTFNVGDDYTAGDREYYQDLWYHPQGFKPLDRGNDLWTGNLAVGLAAKLISESIFDERSIAAALDGGVHFRHSEIQPLSLSFVFRNVGTKPKFNRVRENLPAEISFGAAYDVSWKERRVITAAELGIPYYGKPFGKLGVEYSFNMRGEYWAAIRTGYKSVSAIDLGILTGVVGGIGFGNQHLSVDLGFQPMDALGSTFEISMGWRF